MPSAIRLFISITILITIPILIAWYISHLDGAGAGDGAAVRNAFQPSHIPISKVLAQNLQLANRTRDHGILTHALLELQNPELTVFAGAGYGMHLRDPNPGPGGGMEVFPDGELPKAGGTRYDAWGRVKGLRYAAGLVVTDGRVGPKGVEEEVAGEGDNSWGSGGVKGKVKVKGRKENVRGGWLVYSEGDRSAAEAASLGWATLLLERAGAVDMNNPVGDGRNAYAEAADGMVEWLFDESRNVRFVLNEKEGWDSVASASLEENGTSVEKKGKRVEEGESERWAISHIYNSKQLWADSIFMVPPFLVAYAIARQDEAWLFEAVEHIKVYDDALRERDSPVNKSLWRHIQRMDQPSEGELCCRDESLWLTGNAWVVAGILRVLGVLERWMPKSHLGDLSSEMFQEERLKAKTYLLGVVYGILNELVKHGKNSETGLLENLLGPPTELAPDLWTSAIFGDAAGSALVASSVYRLAQLGMLDDHDMLHWADELYNAVAQQIDSEGIVESVADVSEVPSLKRVSGTSEGQSTVLLMYAARRDCAKLGICEALQQRNWWSWPSHLFGGKNGR